MLLEVYHFVAVHPMLFSSFKFLQCCYGILNFKIFGGIFYAQDLFRLSSIHKIFFIKYTMGESMDSSSTRDS